MRTSLEAGAKIFSDINERTWIHFTFPSLSWWISVHGSVRIEFFLSVREVLVWRFSQIALLLKGLQLGSKSNSTTIWLLFEILLRYVLFRRCIISVDWNLQRLLKCISFWRRQVILIVCLRVFCCVLWIFPYFSAIAFCNIDCWDLSVHFNMTSDVCPSFKIFQKVMN